MRALLLSCSKAKRCGGGAMPARELYDGPAFRVLRKHGGDDLPVWVLSAKYGLIPADAKINRYDRRMTAARADELREQTAKRLDEIPQNKISEWLVCAGKTYARALTDCNWLPPVKKAEGTIGRQISILKQWLENESDSVAQVAPEHAPAGKMTIPIGGERICVSARDALRIAAKAAECKDARNFQTWYVQTPQGEVGAKWLVSELSGLPVARFRTADALRVLKNLGVVYNHKTLQENVTND